VTVNIISLPHERGWIFIAQTPGVGLRVSDLVQGESDPGRQIGDFRSIVYFVRRQARRLDPDAGIVHYRNHPHEVPCHSRHVSNPSADPCPAQSAKVVIPQPAVDRVALGEDRSASRSCRHELLASDPYQPAEDMNREVSRYL
jgi:hypothetical protein